MLHGVSSANSGWDVLGSCSSSLSPLLSPLSLSALGKKFEMPQLLTDEVTHHQIHHIPHTTYPIRTKAICGGILGWSPEPAQYLVRYSKLSIFCVLNSKLQALHYIAMLYVRVLHSTTPARLLSQIRGHGKAVLEKWSGSLPRTMAQSSGPRRDHQCEQLALYIGLYCLHLQTRAFCYEQHRYAYYILVGIQIVVTRCVPCISHACL